MKHAIDVTSAGESIEIIRCHTTTNERGCWVWMRCKDKHGYGRVVYRGRWTLAHRVSFALANGSIPKGICVLHKCDNPSCVNPEHLFSGTQGDNIVDMTRKGRNRLQEFKDSFRGERQHLAKLTGEIAKRIIEDFRGGESQSSIARRLGVNVATVQSVTHGRTWSHVTGVKREHI